MTPFLVRVCVWIALTASLGFADDEADNQAWAQAPPETGDLKIACLGDSITWGQGSSSIWTKSYPMLLKASLGKGYWVGNYGLQSATCMRAGDVPYADSKEYKAAQAVLADIVIIMLGTNDAKVANWDEDMYREDLRLMINTALNAPATKSVFVAMPPPLYEDGKYGIQAEVVNLNFCGDPVGEGIIGTLIKEMDSPKLHLVDVFSALGGLNLSHPEFFLDSNEKVDYGGKDGVHPNDAGHNAIFETMYAALLKAGAIDGVAESPPPPEPVSSPPSPALSPPLASEPAAAPPDESPSITQDPEIPLTPEEEFAKAFGASSAKTRSGRDVDSSTQGKGKSAGNITILLICVAGLALVLVPGIVKRLGWSATNEKSGETKMFSTSNFAHGLYGSVGNPETEPLIPL
ncbi:hypothetical protein CYMTET_10667 [Cymbomonas tetramitiformis]|uniref:SGNH hydrolase-type esterase domain-containing protein n=1 Tax=Cymbomonas tetramitiformis TaxID=36881 RepID=A0AAE0GP15_9CHLO|nr:hypothetical protein CYMTET_10667 [Cymbomonas tetramitiformis]